MHKFFRLTKRSLTENKNALELWQKAQADGYTGLAVSCETKITKETEGETKKYHAIFSTDTEDRHGEIVFQDFDLKAFKKNPVYIDSHNYDSIERIIGRVSGISVKDGALQGDIEFATMNPVGLLAEQMADAGFLNTSSVGFIPKEFDDKGNILKSELLEISAVSIPANSEALYERKDADIEPPAPVAEPEPVEKTEVTGTRDYRATAARAISDMNAQRRSILAATAREITKLKEPGAQKRQALKAVRELLKADIGA